MCFYADYEWTAAEEHSHEGVASEPTRCDECYKTIPAGQYCFYLHQQEHEECQEREEQSYIDDDDNEVFPHDCEKEPGDCRYGETFEYQCCRSCKTLRESIRKVEESEGCRGMEAEPSLTQLFEEVSEGQGWGHYAEKFRELGLTEAVGLIPEGQ